MRIAVNRAYRTQHVTGQQRYAVEIASRLDKFERVRFVDAPSAVAQSAAGTWAWLQGPGLRTQGDEALLSLTSRGPLLHRRHVITVHDLFVLTNPEWFSAAYRQTHRPILRAQLRSAKGVIAVSEPTARSVRDLMGSDFPVAVAPNGVDASFGSSTTVSQHAREVLLHYALRSGTYILCVASVDPRKNLNRLVAAYGILPSDFRKNHPLVIVGGSSAVFNNVATDWPMEVVRAGYVDESVLRILYSNANCVAMTSLAEGFGLPVIEAAASEVPLILSDIDAFRWVYGSGGNYVNPTDVESISQGLLDVTRTPPSAERSLHLSAKAAELRQRFDWDRSARLIHDFIGAL